jgi:hypothetical protein
MPASRSHTITLKPDGGALTLDELAAFVQDAMRSGASGGETPKVRINWGGTIKRIEIEVSPARPAAEDARTQGV